MQRGGHRADAEPRAPCLLAVDAHVELRDVALLARVGLGDPGNRLHRFQGPVRHQLQAAGLRSLHEYLDRLPEAAEDRPLALDRRPDAGNLAQLVSEIALDLEQRPLVAGLERDEHPPVVRRAAEAATDRQVGEVGLGLPLEEGRDLASLVHRVLEPRARRCAEVHAELVAVHLRHPGEAEPRQDEEAHDDRRQRDAHHHEAMGQRPAEPTGIPVGAALEPVVEREGEAPDRVGLAALLRLVCAAFVHRVLDLRIGPHARQHRVESEADEQRDEHGEGDRDAELEEDLADDAAHERDGHEHGDDGEGRRHDGEPDLVGALLGGEIVRFSHLEMAHDVLTHDDGVVDEEPDREREREQGHGVHGEVEHPHDEERADDRHREREPGDDGRSPRVEKQVDDHHRERGAEHDRELDVGERLTDAPRVVLDDGHANVGRQLALELSDGLTHAIGDLDGVRAGDLEDLERHGVGAALRPADLGPGPAVLGAVDHDGDVADAHGRAVSHGDRDVGERRGIDDAPRHAHESLGGAALDATGRYFLVLALERGGELRGRQPVGPQRGGIHLHANLPRVPADDVHAADALDRLEACLHHLAGEVGDLADRSLVRPERDRHDRRVVRVEVLDDRLLDVLRQGTADARHLGLHVLLRDGDVDTEVELQANDRHALERGRGDLLDSLNGVERLLDRLGDVAHHHLGRGSRIRRLRDDDGVGDVGILVDRQALVADDAEHDERHHHHGGEHGALDRDVGEDHRNT